MNNVSLKLAHVKLLMKTKKFMLARDYLNQIEVNDDIWVINMVQDSLKQEVCCYQEACKQPHSEYSSAFLNKGDKMLE